MEFLLLGQQLHSRHDAPLQRQGTQLAREKTPSTAPMVTLVMQAAGREASSAVVTARRGVSSETRRFSQAGNARMASLRGPAHRPRPPLPGKPLSLAKSEGFFSRSLQKKWKRLKSAMVHPRPQKKRLMAEEGELLKLS